MFLFFRIILSIFALCTLIRGFYQVYNYYNFLLYCRSLNKDNNSKITAAFQILNTIARHHIKLHPNKYNFLHHPAHHKNYLNFQNFLQIANLYQYFQYQLLLFFKEIITSIS